MNDTPTGSDNRTGPLAWAELILPPGESPIPTTLDFYRDFLGWAGSDRIDSIDLTQLGAPAAAIRSEDSAQRAHWRTVFDVADLDVTLERVNSAGGSVLAETTTGTSSRGAVITDSAGVELAVREADANPTVSHATTWAELITDDVDASAAFYGAAFGWTLSEPEGPLGRREWRHPDGTPFSGLLPRPPAMAAEIPPYWDIYFRTADLASATEAAPALGGTVLMPPTPLPLGTIGVFLDPVGAVFTLLQPNTNSEPENGAQHA